MLQPPCEASSRMTTKIIISPEPLCPPFRSRVLEFLDHCVLVRLCPFGFPNRTQGCLYLNLLILLCFAIIVLRRMWTILPRCYLT